MLERQDLATAEKAATVVNQLVVDCLEHVHVYIRELDFLQFCQALVSLVKIHALAARNLVVLAAARLLRFLVAKMVRLADSAKSSISLVRNCTSVKQRARLS